MKLDFYGVKINPPTESTSKAFGSRGEIIVLKGGQGTSYKSGNIVLKPSDGEQESIWMAELFSNLPGVDGVRLAKPIKSTNGTWIHEGYVAWTFLEGEHVKGHYDKKLTASVAFHSLLKNIPYPDYLKNLENPWAVANREVWEKQEYKYDEEFLVLINQITKRLVPLHLASQLIHGDLSGNILLHNNVSPAIIDFSPAWAPNGFAEGIMLADAIAWEHADLEDLHVFKEIPNIAQLSLRGVLRRIIEQAEHIKWFNKDKAQAIEEANQFKKAIDIINLYFV